MSIMSTGSNHPMPAGALFFERDGSVHLHLSSFIEEKDEESITMAADFFQYALQREDWLKIFLDQKYQEPSKRPFSKADLRLIPGGLYSGSQVN